MREFLLLADENGLAAAASVCVTLAVLLLLFLLLQRGRYHAPGAGKRDDFAKMLILFQTMRDLLDQQKSLARELNEAIDAKVNFVKDRVEAAQIDLANMRNDIQEMGRAIDTHRRLDPPNRPAPPERSSAFDSTPDRGELAPEDRLRLLALPERDSDQGDRLDSWVGLDLGDELAPKPLDEAPEQPVEAPADPESAREAFRSLLSHDPLPGKGGNTSRPPALAEPGPNPNGEGRITPAIKGRVFEYSEAGMTISQIAKELGIGKGEVRLILSLRDIQGS